MAKLVKMKGTEKPGIMTVKWSSENKPIYASINTNIINDADDYYWDSLVLPEYALNNIYAAPNDIKYKVLIIHILRAYYDDNDVTAIIANYMSDTTNEKYKKEFDELQNCRNLAKTLANNIVASGLF